MKHSLIRPLKLVAALSVSVLLGTTHLAADTIYLKNGNQILDCKVTSETATHVSAQTPVGAMVVPRTEVSRIVRTKTVYDKYADQLAAIREGDANGLFNLALWCRSTAGLRKESQELLDRVIEINAEHTAARRLLGHLKIGTEWIVPPPLSLRLKVSGANASEMRSHLGILLATRKDVRWEYESRAGTEGGNPLDRCNLDVSVNLTRKAPGRFYGTQVGRAWLNATIRLEAQGPWIGKTLKTSADGQVPADAGDSALAIRNALGSSSTSLHRFLDELTQMRLKKLEDGLKKQEREKSAAATAAARP